MATSSDDGTEADTLKLTVAALAISIAAILLSTLQALLAYLQFDNSEVGRRRCSEEVMGKLWAGRTTRKFKWREFRYQVFFEVPVFYTAPPDITVGPLTKTKPELTFLDRLWSASASEPAQDDNRTFQEEARHLEVIEIQKHVHPIYKITGTESSCRHTMTKFSNDNDKWASVHTAEDEGCSWVLLLDALQGQERASRSWDKSEHSGQNHTISYLIQRKRRCWDFMPLNVTKPFATTTICHLVEIISMLGLVWVEFDMKRSILSAEGNGYMVKSEYMPGLGVLTRFSRLSKPDHEENRMIPCKEIKRFCFGEVPSIFDLMKHNLQFGPGKLESCLSHLMPQLASHHRKSILNPNERPFIFPHTFELLGMVAKSVHLPGSRFRRLPNPCAAVWAPHLDIASCLRHFSDLLEKNTTLGDDELTKELQGLFKKGRMYTFFLKGSTMDQKLSAYDRDTSAYTKAKTDTSWAHAPNNDGQKHEEYTRERYTNTHIDMLDSLHDALEVIDNKLQEDLLDDVRQVLTAHFTATLNQQSELEKELANATLDNPKEKILINFYFGKVHPQVAREMTEDLNDNTAVSLPPTTVSGSDASTLCASSLGADRRSAVWLALMFRLWSWLFLHDFNSADRMIERSEFKDNRLPVYIS